MPTYQLLRNPSANRVFGGEVARLGAAELQITAPFVTDVTDIGGAGYWRFDAPQLDDGQLAALASNSAALALFEQVGDLLRPIDLPEFSALDTDLVSIPKYQGKTNEQFTQLLLNVTLATVERDPTGARQVLDPMAGRGTTLSTALLAGCDAYGVELDRKAFDQAAAFYKTYLRRKRVKHTADVRPVRRDGKSLGSKFEAKIQTRAGNRTLELFTGDARDSAKLYREEDLRRHRH